ncbi:MAG: helix-turn-helix domain-containing protein [Chitinophagaceae bacterium]|nr:MAG: helix-turn-helix domain-containing protein [Chitinophagaceae bacterium]
MNMVNKNIRFLRNADGLTQEKFAEEFGIKRSLLGAYEEGRSNPNYKVMMLICQRYKISMESLLKEDLSSSLKHRISKHSGKNGNALIDNDNFRLLTITVDNEGRENIELVSQKAAAGYLSGYADEEFIKELPKFRLPFLQSGTYRAFEITGDSMLPIQPGSILIGQYVETAEDLKDGSPYVVVSKNDGIVFKRVMNQLKDEGKLYLHSDNKAYPPYAIGGEDLLEAWKVELFISRPDNKPGVSMEDMMSMVIELQQEVMRLKGHKSA